MGKTINISRMGRLALAITVGVILSALLVNGQNAESDKVTSLPGLETVPELYSGFFNLGDGDLKQSFHYLFLPSLGDKTKDPIIVWNAGGPGCSGVESFFKSIGPFTFPDGDSEGKLVENPYTWAKFASILIIDAPGTVGFSYWENKEKSTESAWSDEELSGWAYDALAAFFGRFPSYLEREVWLAGEGYAAISNSYLGVVIFTNNNDEKKTLKIKLKGVILGNALLEEYKSQACLEEFMWKHQLISPEIRNILVDVCTFDPRSARCLFARQEVDKATARYNIYDIYGYCYGKDGSFAEEGMQCLDIYAFTEWLDKEEVRKALHIPASNDEPFKICQQLNFTRASTDDVKYLRDLAELDFPLLFYSGDTDMNVPYTCTLRTLENQSWKLIEEWRAWYVDTGRLGGFLMQWMEGKKVTFATIYGTGHLAAQWKPEEVSLIVSRTLKGETF
eukprot:TRINITY_DN1773_c0_g2_i1.p1 TRINITY_DN1773_c0_g2~~TRINITY_DN1773_c0_g2_i1.p1  ORF type:complete len:449 (-),score=129.43 TRINITY_DN1773_c0_g2_i1:388-1734(-)